MEPFARKLLVIGYVWPEPNSSAAGSHILSVIRLFQERRWEVHFASPAARGEHECDLAGERIEAHEIHLNCRSFDQFVSKLEPQVVLFDRFLMEEQFGWRVAQACPNALRVLDLEDLHSLRKARHEAVKKGLSYTQAELDTDEAKREVAAIFRSDLSLVISEAEMELLTTFYQVPRAILVSCPFLLEPNTGKISSFAERAHFISLGNFRHAPNWDAVLQLKEEIWRLIRKALPDVELHLYGAYPPPKATKLHQPQDGFLVKGWAPDARKVMAEARVCLAPLRFGAGLKGKLTEAMLCGTPSVTTEVGAEGIQGSMLWPGAVVDDAENFARKAVLLYTQEREWVASQERGGDLLRARFNRQKIGERVMDQVQEGLENLETYRAGNFVGSMLQHQSMKATQYLSQWIEAKNKNGEGAS